MPVQLIRLRGVHEDEARELRELLETHGIDFYETPAGNWGVSMPAIWLRDETELAQAQALLNDYQAQRTARVRNEYRQLREAGEHRTFLRELQAHPARIIAYLVIVAIILYFSTIPFTEIAG
ncbi:MAG: DUF6164 family protein [Gammaproteobacteria bacterium]|nr:DUF6164 family protein [Gammaproteobacteria bacterium]